ncbi:MAG: cyclic nucleotide-binding domain-containing protein, partial [Pseudomonadota bacterium]
DVLSRHDDVTDMLKATPLNWPAATQKGVAFRQRFQLALNIQRRFGLTAPLAGALAQRLGVLEFMKQVLRDQQDTTIAEIERLLPEEARAAFRECATHRFEMVTEQAEALALQFPDYAAALHRRDLMLAGLRLEENAYDRLLEQSIIGPEIHNDLVKRLESANANADRLPPLRLKLNAAELVGKVPFFEVLSRGRRKRIARLLKTRFFVPGDRIIIRGEIGEDMYFIASGAVRVLLPDQQIPLGTGDFFGELALITDQPRNADVEAVGFSTLLCLQRRDFAAFLRRHPDVRDAIRKTAKERLGVGADITL